MLTMTQVHDIRKMFFEEGKNISEIARETKRDRKTIRFYLEKDDWNQAIPAAETVASYPKLLHIRLKLIFGSWRTRKLSVSKGTVRQGTVDMSRQ